MNRHRPTYIKRDDGVTVVQIFNKDVVQVNREGEVLLDTGGDRGVGVLRAVNEALAKFGFKVTAARDDAETWTVSDGLRYFKRYEDGLVIPKPHPPGPGRALAPRTSLTSRVDEWGRRWVTQLSESTRTAASSVLLARVAGQQLGT